MQLPPYVNEPYTDFTQPDQAPLIEAALRKVRSEFGREYPLLIAGEGRASGKKVTSLNPSDLSEVVGIHPKGTPQDAQDAIDRAAAYFPTWAAVPVEMRAGYLVRIAQLIRERKYELDAWLVLESGKTWAEAEADVSEAVDFCEYYARHALKLAHPEPVVQLSGERDEFVYLPLGVGIIIPPWNFPLAILLGIKPSTETPTIASKFAELMLAAGIPAQAFSLLNGSGPEVGEALVTNPKARFISFTGSRNVGLRINELAAKTPKGQLWIKRVVAEMGGKDAIIVDSEADLDQAVLGVLYSAFGFQGQKCSACSRAIVDASVYDEFLTRLKAKTEAITQGPSEKVANYMGPVISQASIDKIMSYIEIGKTEGRLITGGDRATGNGHYVKPTIFAEVDSKARIFQEEIFGPVLAVAKARDFDHAIALANDSEYGLTGAVFTKNKAKIERARREFFVGNLYINRKCTGAMVGAHPFGGFNMSGTDSKAGGPDYLLQFVQGKSIAEKL
jgi:1-pyrroline-5-carboxylate dehydrogenase